MVPPEVRVRRDADSHGSRSHRGSPLKFRDVVSWPREGLPTVGTLLERQTELGAIAEVLAHAPAGDARPVLFEGPPGIGKTALLREACARARSERMLTLTARGADLERSFPFGCVRQLFERVVLRGPAEARGLLAGAAGLAAPVFGLARPARLLPPADDREAALIGLYWLLVALADSAPIVVA